MASVESFNPLVQAWVFAHHRVELFDVRDLKDRLHRISLALKESPPNLNQAAILWSGAASLCKRVRCDHIPKFIRDEYHEITPEDNESHPVDSFISCSNNLKWIQNKAKAIDSILEECLKYSFYIIRLKGENPDAVFAVENDFPEKISHKDISSDPEKCTQLEKTEPFPFLRTAYKVNDQTEFSFFTKIDSCDGSPQFESETEPPRRRLILRVRNLEAKTRKWGYFPDNFSETFKNITIKVMRDQLILSLVKHVPLGFLKCSLSHFLADHLAQKIMSSVVYSEDEKSNKEQFLSAFFEVMSECFAEFSQKIDASYPQTISNQIRKWKDVKSLSAKHFCHLYKVILFKIIKNAIGSELKATIRTFFDGPCIISEENLMQALAKFGEIVMDGLKIKILSPERRENEMILFYSDLHDHLRKNLFSLVKDEQDNFLKIWNVKVSKNLLVYVGAVSRLGQFNIDQENWAVSLLSAGTSTGDFLIRGGHAMICIEGVQNGGYFREYAHLCQDGVKYESVKFSYYVEGNRYDNFNIDWRLQNVNFSKTWIRKAWDVKNMQEVIEEELKTQWSLSLPGMVAGFNCLGWAIEIFKNAKIELPPYMPPMVPDQYVQSMSSYTDTGTENNLSSFLTTLSNGVKFLSRLHLNWVGLGRFLGGKPTLTQNVTAISPLPASCPCDADPSLS